MPSGHKSTLILVKIFVLPNLFWIGLKSSIDMAVLFLKNSSTRVVAVVTAENVDYIRLSVYRRKSKRINKTSLPGTWNLVNETLNHHKKHFQFSPPQSPDLSPCDLVLWGYLNHKCIAANHAPFQSWKKPFKVNLKQFHAKWLRIYYEKVQEPSSRMY